MTMNNLLINHRYQLIAEIGRGGMGVVYKAADTLLERDVAVKVLINSSLGTQGRARLLREAQAAARLNHPNIISIYDAGDADGMSYIVMELLDGDSLYEKKPSGLENLLDVLTQICQALSHAHAHGIIHRDLKPENVIVTSKGVAKLTDFGLSRSMTARASFEGGIVGTVYYLAPEQALKQDVDARADLYALGVMMYEMMAGRLPFVADDPLAVISQHLNAPVVPPSTYNPRIPQVLDQLIVRLLSKRPEDRPATALEVCQTLEGLLETGEPVESTPVEQQSPLERLTCGRLVGRKEEFARVRALWREVFEVPFTHNTMLISGEPGVGKTPLVKEVRTLAEVSGARVLSGECYARNGAPYAPFPQILRELSPLPEELPGLVLADVLSLLPEMSAEYEAQSAQAPLANLPVSPQADQRRLLESVFLLFSALAQQQPLALMIEDVHWADSGTLRLLHHLARRSRTTGLRLMIVMTYRASEVDDTPDLRRLLLDLNQERLSQTVDLQPFTREQTRELLKTMFVEEISDHFLNAIYGVTEGNLFFIEEICKTLIEEERLTFYEGGWHFSGLDQLEMPQSVRMALEIRLSRLPQKAQDVLYLAAVIGREFDFEILRSACEMDEDTLIDALELAERAQLISEVRHKSKNGAAAGRETFAFDHTLTPTILYDDISSLRRHRMHRRIAAVMERLRPDDLEGLAYHYTQAADPEKASQYHLRAGARARKLFANQDAVCFYSEALRLIPDNTRQRFEALAEREQVYDLLAERDAQRADIDAMLILANRLDDEGLHCDALLALAHFYLDTEHILAREPAQEAAALARQMKDLVREGRALRALGWGAWMHGDYHESLSALETAVIRFRQAGLLSEAAECLHMLSLVTGGQGLGELAIAQQYAEDAIRISQQAGDRRQEAISLRRLAIVYLDQMKYEEALRASQKALALHAELGDRAEECSALNAIGVALMWLGRKTEARDHFLRSLELAVEIDSNLGVSNAVGNLQYLYFRAEGDLESGLELIDQQLANLALSGHPYLKNMLLGGKAEVMAMMGQYEEALRLINKVKEASSAYASSTNLARHTLFAAKILAEMGQFERAWQELEKARAFSPRFERAPEAAYLLSVQVYMTCLENIPEKMAAMTETAEKAILLLRDTAWEHDLAEMLHVGALLDLALENSSQALARTTEMMKLAATLPSIPENYLLAHARALRGCGQEVEAALHLEQAYQRVIQITGKLKDPRRRKSWLERVKVNREILIDWQKYSARDSST